MRGGIGNQLFQISTGYSVAKQINRALFIKQNSQYDMIQGSLPSKYTNSIYQDIKQVNEVKGNSLIIEEKQWAAYDIMSQIHNSKNIDNIILRGYFQSEEYFLPYREELRELFIPKFGPINFLEQQTEKILCKFPELKVNHDYCFIGVRRGDYVTYSHVHNPCGMTYYNKAMNLMNKERYYIASDDIEWCKTKFIGKQYYFFDIKDDLSQLMIMTLFPNYIISNSSYHWWGSYLSVYDNPVVIAPNLWIGGAEAPFDSYKTIYRKEMKILTRPVEINY